ncbi:tudor domain-containing protein 5-like [Ornithodoros turicata]|uniref:tudor domain-containing protein 5-like n=1 Tax=Ornithodoros turicata TaxID=34597 RepID=UPI0031395188
MEQIRTKDHHMTISPSLPGTPEQTQQLATLHSQHVFIDSPFSGRIRAAVFVFFLRCESCAEFVMAHRVQELENIKHVIRALLLVNNGPMRVDAFVKQYRFSEGHAVPYQRFGYSDCMSFLANLDDTVTIRSDSTGTFLSPKISETAGRNVLHIQELIRAQKQETKVPATTKKRSPRMSRVVTPHLPENLHRNLCVLVSKFREGIDIGFVEDAYYREFGTMMNTEAYGFNSLEDCLATVDCLELMKQSNGKTRVRLKASTRTATRSLSRNRNSASSFALKSSSCNTSNSASPEKSSSVLKENVKKVLEKYPNGVFLSSFAQVYKEVSDQELEITTMDIIQRWPELFHLERPHSGSDFMVFSSDCVLDVTDSASRSGSSNSSSSGKHDIVVKTYKQAQLPEADAGSYFPVKVSHVFTPGRLTIQLVDPRSKDPVSALMKRMDDLYTGPESLKYALQPGSVVIGQAVAAQYSPVDNNAVWYRASVTGVCNLFSIEVELVDFGNRCIVRKSELRLIREDFLDLPAQAIAVSLAFIRPRGGDDWSERAYKELVLLSGGKILMCQIVERSATPPAVVLCDTTREDEVEIFLADALVEAGYAEFVVPVDSAEDSLQNGTVPNGNISEVDYDAIRLVSLSGGERFHVVPYEGVNYVTSFDLSRLLGWEEDSVVQRLSEKEIVFPHRLLHRQDTPEVFDKVNSLDMEEREGALHAQCLCLFPIKSIADAVNIFRHPHNEINGEIRQVVHSYATGNPVGEVVYTERLLLLGELHRMRERKKRLYAGFSREMANVERVDQIQDLEVRIECLAQRLERMV